MPSLNICFKIHQPIRLRRDLNVFNLPHVENYFDNKLNEKIIKKIVKESYLPANKIILGLINKHKKKFKVAYSISGTALEQLEQYSPEFIESFKKIVNTGCVEILASPYYESLAYRFSKIEFRKQVRMLSDKIKRLFNYKPRVFRNTGLLYNNKVALLAKSLGYKTVITEGTPRLLGWKSPNYVYESDKGGVKLLLKNKRVSDEVVCGFEAAAPEEWPLTAGRLVAKISASKGDIINMIFNYEIFCEKKRRGIFEFLKDFPEEALSEGIRFMTPSQAVKKFKPLTKLNVNHTISECDVRKDLTAWRHNIMQKKASKEIYAIKKLMNKKSEYLEVWRKLQEADHFYYMCTKWTEDYQTHKAVNPFGNPYDAFIVYMNVLDELKRKLLIKEVL